MAALGSFPKMKQNHIYDFAIIGGGLIGLATARAISKRVPESKLLILEKEEMVAAHQSGRNSGVIHSGIYYPPGTLKASLIVQGRKALIDFCKKNDVSYELCGKVILAARSEEIPRLGDLAVRGRKHGLNVQLLSPRELAEIEPHAKARKALLVPEAGIVDFAEVARTMALSLKEAGIDLRLGVQLMAIEQHTDLLHLKTNNGDYRARYLINCAGLYSDRVARLAGLKPDVRIVPFRGEYFSLRAQKRDLVRGLIYPLPHPRFPFLGVHLTRTVGGDVLAGPNAVLSLKREGYKNMSFNLRDALGTFTYSGFWRLALANMGTGLTEMLRSWSAASFARNLQEMLPEIKIEDLRPARSGVRAQAVDRRGNLVSDFHFLHAERSLHVLNAPSPAATASFAIGEYVAERAVMK